MPVVFRSGNRKFFFYSDEGDPREPLHVHVRGGGGEAKIWLEPDMRIADSRGFNARELADMITQVKMRKSEIERAWNEHFRD